MDLELQYFGVVDDGDCGNGVGALGELLIGIIEEIACFRRE